MKQSIANSETAKDTSMEELFSNLLLQPLQQSSQIFIQTTHASLLCVSWLMNGSVTFIVIFLWTLYQLWT